MSRGKYRLLGGEVSYFTGKARSYLRFKAIPFDEVLATRDVYKNEIMPRVGFPVVPVLITPDDETLQDTTVIIDALEEKYPNVSVYPMTPKQHLLALLLELYGDEWLKLPAMHYRWNYNMDFAVAEFGALSRPDLGKEEQLEVGRRTSKNFAGSLPFLGVTDATIAAIEESYEALLQHLNVHFKNYRFLFGDRLSIGDLGLIGPLYAHLYRDPASGEIMQRIAPGVVEWVKRMYDPDPGAGDFLADDVIPESLDPIIQRMVDEQFPVLKDTIRKLAEWLDTHTEEDIPRAIGMHEFTLLKNTGNEVTEQQGIFPYQQWMFQRAHDYYNSLDEASRRTIDSYLTPFGALELLQTPIRHRLRIENFNLVRT